MTMPERNRVIKVKLLCKLNYYLETFKYIFLRNYGGFDFEIFTI